MEALAKQPYFKEIAHYCCELAQSALLASDFTAARRHIDQALAEYKACARATMLLGDMHLQQGELGEAILAWQRIESQNPAFLSLVAERLADAYRKTGNSAQGLRVLRAYQQQYPSLDLLNTVFSLTLADEGPEPRASSSRRSSRAIRRCSDSTGCWKHSFSPRPSSAATTSSS